MKVTLFIEAPPDFFCSWLEDYTQDAPYRSFPTEKGYISLQRARPSRLHGYMGMEGIYCTFKDESTQTAIPISEVIRFKVIPLTPNRTEIAAECNQPVVERYFLHLLNEISKRWPQPADVEARLVEIKRSLEAGFADVKRGQAVLYKHVDQASRESLEQIRESIRLGRVEQGEMALAIDAIRRALQLMRAVETQVSKDVCELLDVARTAVESELGLQQKLEVTLPILPLFLSYSVELAAGSELDINAVVSDIRERWKSLIAQAREHEDKKGAG
jgi:hypothetical protein